MGIKRGTEMENVKLTIEGMRCGGCVKRVTTVLGQTPGVAIESVAVGTAVVSVNPAQATSDTVVKALAGAGYRAHTEAIR